MDEVSLNDGSVTDEYVQLYIPYEYFSDACKLIKSIYNEGEKGYKNYMSYWARNGEYNWICDTSEYPGTIPENSDVKLVKNTYLVKTFWNNYKGETSPLNGGKITYNNGKAYGFE